MDSLSVHVLLDAWESRLRGKTTKSSMLESRLLPCILLVLSRREHVSFIRFCDIGCLSFVFVPFRAAEAGTTMVSPPSLRTGGFTK